MKKQRNEVLEEYKKSMFGSQTNFEDSINEDAGEGGPSKFNAKTLLSATMKFGISSRTGS